MGPDVLRLRYELVHMRRRMRDHPGASREEILAFQRRKLRYVIDNAYESVPYYRRLFDRAGVKPEDIRTADDLAALPITTKQDLRDAPDEDVIARWANPKRMHVRTTSGS